MMGTRPGGLAVWLGESQGWFEGLLPELVSRLGEAVAVDFSGLEDLGIESRDVLVVLLSPDDARVDQILGWLEELETDRRLTLIVVCDDSHLGTDVKRGPARVSGAAVALVRSLAVGRGTRVRANVICVPRSSLWDDSEIRGVLAQTPELRDLVEAIALFAGEDGSYLSGQILYLGSGRQLFSSQTA